MQARTCEHCGAVWAAADALRLTKSERRIFNYVQRHPGCSMSDIIEHLYADRANGGPDTANLCVSKFIQRIRSVIRPLGMDFKTQRGPGATYTLAMPKAKGTIECVR